MSKFEMDVVERLASIEAKLDEFLPQCRSNTKFRYIATGALSLIGFILTTLSGYICFWRG